MWLSGERRESHHPPSLARRNAQLRQIIRIGQCVHPEQSLVLNKTVGGGFIEYCSDCMHVTEIYTPKHPE